MAQLHREYEVTGDYERRTQIREQISRLEGIETGASWQDLEQPGGNESTQVNQSVLRNGIGPGQLET